MLTTIITYLAGADGDTPLYYNSTYVVAKVAVLCWRVNIYIGKDIQFIGYYLGHIYFYLVDLIIMLKQFRSWFCFYACWTSSWIQKAESYMNNFCKRRIKYMLPWKLIFSSFFRPNVCLTNEYPWSSNRLSHIDVLQLCLSTFTGFYFWFSVELALASSIIHVACVCNNSRKNIWSKQLKIR